MTDHEHVFDHRTGANRGIVNSVDDSGVAQVATVTTNDGVTRTAEVHQPFGFAAVPPANGAVMILIGNGGDPSDMIALAASCPFGRLGGLQPGEAAIYAADGTRVHVKQGGIIEIIGATEVQITVPEVHIVASSGLTLTGNASISGTLSVDGNVSVGGALSISGNTSIGGNLTVAGEINNP